MRIRSTAAWNNCHVGLIARIALRTGQGGVKLHERVIKSFRTLHGQERRTDGDVFYDSICEWVNWTGGEIVRRKADGFDGRKFEILPRFRNQRWEPSPSIRSREIYIIAPLPFPLSPFLSALKTFARFIVIIVMTTMIIVANFLDHFYDLSGATIKKQPFIPDAQFHAPRRCLVFPAGFIPDGATSLNNSSSTTKSLDWSRLVSRNSSHMRAGRQANKVRLWRARGVTERARTRDKKSVLVVGVEILARQVYKLLV